MWLSLMTPPVHTLQSLGILIAVPGFWLILTLLAFLIFFLCRCCDSGLKKKRRLTPLKWILAFFALLCWSVLKRHFFVFFFHYCLGS